MTADLLHLVVSLRRFITIARVSKAREDAPLIICSVGASSMGHRWQMLPRRCWHGPAFSPHTACLAVIDQHKSASLANSHALAFSPVYCVEECSVVALEILQADPYDGGGHLFSPNSFSDVQTQWLEILSTQLTMMATVRA